MNAVRTPNTFGRLIEAECINQSDIINTEGAKNRLFFRTACLSFGVNRDPL